MLAGGVPPLDKTIDLTLAAANLVAIHKYGTTRGLGVLDVKLRILRGKVVNGEAVREKPQCTPIGSSHLGQIGFLLVLLFRKTTQGFRR